MKQDTLITTAGRDPEKNHGIVNPPVYHASTIVAPTLAEFRERRAHRWEPGVFTYGRQGTPTHEGFETAVAALLGGDRAVAMGSGLAAINAAMLAYLQSGDHVLMVDSVYGPARAFCNKFLARFGVTTTYYDPSIGAGIAALIQDNTKIVYTESPGSLTFEVQDIRAIADEAHKRGCIVIIDDTWSSGVFFKPFEHGADVSVIAATKYIVGHSDVMMGVITTTDEQWQQVRQSASDLGANAGPDDVYLALRGLRTIGVRMRQHYENGMKLAQWLQARPEVEAVLHPGLPEFPSHELWKRDFTGACGLFGVLLKPFPEKALAAMLDDLAYYGMGASWGGFESLILLTDPAAIRVATKERWETAGPTLRIHAGLEDIDDLIDDLEKGFERMNANA
ncbi:MAG: cystathionine beta-lyase [Rhodospirillaceae bacterium]|jgi:cysteine-S-conjugate beta-lyase|nr:cystathionine beta-lyase [Rhodospirillaceae bacterium]MBT5457966.1 cystathionine beta-lyase [Rhodospirillaceae bacterium]